MAKAFKEMKQALEFINRKKPIGVEVYQELYDLMAKVLE